MTRVRAPRARAPAPPSRATEAGEQVLVEITGLAPGGEAVGRQIGGEHAGRVVFVPFAAPGERVRARVVRRKARVAWATLEDVEVVSSERVRPPCPVFGRCGGCQWQHVTRAAQREAKRQIVERALGVPVGEVHAVGPEYGYRQRARLTVGTPEKAGSPPPIGFRAFRSHAIVDVASCPLLTGPVDAVLPLVRADARGAAPGTEIALQGGGERVVVAAGRARRAYAVSGGLVSEAPVSPREEPEVNVAEPDSPPLRIPAGAFAQVGAVANRALVQVVLEAIGERPGRLLELHAGSGNFTRHLVGRASEVIATDGDRQAVARGRRHVPGARWVEDRSLAGIGPVDTVMLDPPREGLERGDLDLVAAARHRVVYVSCDPQTLGRDARRLAASGWRLERVVALDLMPQTFHVEVMASFARNA